MAETALTVRGMTCANCVKHVTAALRAVPGVTAATVTLPDRAIVTHATGTELAALVAAVADAGYDAAPAHAAAQNGA
jgi:copper chaperone CopZ